MPKMMSDEKRLVRCAIYTRKSTEEGLNKEFNTLDAQREAGEAYISSQKNEGWICLPERYDDGGFTGGNLERPALQRLLNDVRAGKVNCIVVYKIDRLSRSLMDFAKIVEVLDEYSASFVSVTQQFNTKDSMGRLTLNILLSFAQFEREIISERTRDKIAAARRKGKWTGGIPILGYDVDHERSKLVINHVEADRVRQIFNLYLQHRSLREVVNELDALGWTSKNFTTTRGHVHRGIPYNKQRLSKLLQNVVYLGKVRYKTEIHEGEHEAIIDPDTWQEVQIQLKRGDRTPDRQARNKHKALLRGILFCGSCDAPMIHIPVTNKSNKVYRYYVCNMAHTKGYKHCHTKSVPADELESFVIERLIELGSNDEILDSVVDQTEDLWKEHIEDIRREINRLTRRKEVLQQGLEVSDQRELRATNSQLRTLQEQLRDAEDRGITPIECEDALGRFESLWSCLTIDEQGQLLRLVYERIDYDGETGKVSFYLHESSPIVSGNEPQ